ncbi:hypothetical protein PACTADRAFT_51055, partial [Pachysolen tannophilus NRRL Y-2460]
MIRVRTLLLVGQNIKATRAFSSRVRSSSRPTFKYGAVKSDTGSGNTNVSANDTSVASKGNGNNTSYTGPPTYFDNLSEPPKTFDEIQNEAENSLSTGNILTSSTSASTKSNEQQAQTQRSDSISNINNSSSGFSSSGSNSKYSQASSLKNLASGLALLALIYFAVDNYQMSKQLRLEIFENNIKNLKNIQLLQQNFNNYQRKRELQILQERKKLMQRELKMSFHIAVLRKQLIDHGIDPVEVDTAIAQFEKNVKVENSVSNVTGQSFWVV